MKTIILSELVLAFAAMLALPTFGQSSTAAVRLEAGIAKGGRFVAENFSELQG